MQLYKDVSQLCVHRPISVEATALGSATCAAVLDAIWEEVTHSKKASND